MVEIYEFTKLLIVLFDNILRNTMSIMIYNKNKPNYSLLESNFPTVTSLEAFNYNQESYFFGKICLGDLKPKLYNKPNLI